MVTACTSTTKTDQEAEILLDVLKKRDQKKKKIAGAVSAIVIGVVSLTISIAIFAENKGFERGRAYQRSIQTQTITNNESFEALRQSRILLARKDTTNVNTDP